MLTNSSGATTATFTYSAYGALAGKTGTQTTFLGYAGQYTNSQSGLQYLRARVYDPVTGQFMTRDSIASVSRQPYAYAGDDPANLTDRSGKLALEAEEACYWPYCPSPQPALEYVGETFAEMGETIEAGWDWIFGDGDSADDGPEPGQCPLGQPPAQPNFDDPTQAPGAGWEWRGRGEVGTKEGSWYNPETKEKLHPDLGHADPVGPHYDWETPNGDYRVYPDGRVEPKPGG